MHAKSEPRTAYTDLILRIIASLTLLVATVAAAQVRPATFANPVNYDSGSYLAWSVIVTDLNNDGHPDFAVANVGAPNFGPALGQIGVLFGNGDGTFQPAYITSSGGYNSFSVAAINYPFLVASNYCQDFECNLDGSVSVLGYGYDLGNYDSGGNDSEWVAAGDLNGDGKQDIVVANTGSGNVAVMLGNGDGTFQPPTLYDNGGGGSGPSSVAIADVNGDGKPDLIVANIYANNVGVLLGNGDGTFQPARTYSSGGNFPFSVEVADLNGDGKPDIAVANCGSFGCFNGGVVGVLFGNGDGTFRAPVVYNSGGSHSNSVAIGDINGDGYSDLVVANVCANPNWFDCGSALGQIGVLLGNGDGTFQPAVDYSSGGYSSNSVAIADVNGDGKPDLVVANNCSDPNCNGTGSVSVLLNTTKYITSTTLTSSLNPSIYGRTVVFSATVTTASPVPATGKVLFTWSGYTIGSATLNNSGIATLVKSNLNADPFPLTAVYKGDANYLGSTSPVLNQTVLQTKSAATINSRLNPSTRGQAVTFTAKVTSPTVTPTGPVTFEAGTTVLGTVELSGGRASYTTTSLPSGSTVIKVTFNGDSNIKESSAMVTQVVQP